MADEEQIQPNTDAAIASETLDNNAGKYPIIVGEVYGVVLGDATSIVMAFFGVAASISSVTQVILMIADMHSKKAKKNILSTPEVNKKSRNWDNIKEIKIQMSDGSQVQIDSWLHDPEKVKGFLETFTSPSASPKPEKVVFVLKNGSRLPVAVSNEPESKQDLDALIQYLKSE